MLSPGFVEWAGEVVRRRTGLVFSEPRRAAFEAGLHKAMSEASLAEPDSYEVASKVHDLIVKTRPNDTEKISLIRDIIAKNVNVKKILEAL